METIKTEDDSNHWRESLLGETFWSEQERLNRPNEELVEAARSLTLHKRFPFNLSDEPSPRQQTSPKKQRRFSTGDAWSLGTLSSTPVADLLHDSNKRPSSTFRIRSPTRLIRKAGSLLRASFRASKGKNAVDPIHPTPIQKDLGSPAKPLLFFDSGAKWNHAPSDMESLCIRFWPSKQSEPERRSKENKRDMLDVDQMAQLCDFRNLRVLRITGMMQSFQKYIWRAAWLNLNLEELELGMALAPRIRASVAENRTDWPLIRGGWDFEVSVYSDPVYYGELGDGNLHRKVGAGEYLDKHAIEKARILAGVTGRTLNRLSIKKLTLSGFVVDADPFIQWFDPKRLRTIHFKENCVDAGFYLARPLKAVVVLFPKEESLPARSVDLSTDLKVVELKNGKKVGEVACRLGRAKQEVVHGKRVSHINPKDRNRQVNSY